MAATVPPKCTEDCGEGVESTPTNDEFKKWVIDLLCLVQTNTNPETLIDTELVLLCDPSTGARIYVRYQFDETGAIESTTAWTLEGVAYGGDIDSLVQCEGPNTEEVSVQELPAATASTDNFANPTTTNIMAMEMLWDGTAWDRAPGNTADGALVNLGANNDVIVTSGTLTAVTSITNPVVTHELLDATATYAASGADSVAYAASLVVKATPGVLFGFAGYNSGPAQFIQVHNTTTLPADTAIPIIILAVAAASNFSYDFGRFGRFFSAGITLANSTTGPTLTTGAADCWFDANYK